MSVVARSPDGTIRLYCKGSDAKVMKKVRADTPAELVDNTNANLHYFAKQVRRRAAGCWAGGGTADGCVGGWLLAACWGPAGYLLAACWGPAGYLLGACWGPGRWHSARLQAGEERVLAPGASSAGRRTAAAPSARPSACSPAWLLTLPSRPAPPCPLLQGLRTLVLGTKIIDDGAYQEWDRRYQEAAASFVGRDEKLDALGREIEEGLELIGVTAIEDKLQVGGWGRGGCRDVALQLLGGETDRLGSWAGRAGC